MPSTNSMNGKFELPKLGPLDSLTAGTNIPPPLESPKEEKPPIEIKQEKPSIEAKKEKPPVEIKPENASAAPDGAAAAAPAIRPQSHMPPATNGHSTTAYHEPPTPTSVGKPSSVRRIFNRKSMYGNGTFAQSSGNLSQPDSVNGSVASSRLSTGKKRNSSWFRRLMSGGESKENKRSSVVFEEVEEPPAKKIDHGPPPPKLPELSQLKSRVEGESLGGEDLFKNIH